MRYRLLALALLVGSCAREIHDDDRPQLRRSEPKPVVARPPPVEPVKTEPLEVPGDQPVFALRGVKPGARAVGVFLHGFCSHGLGLLQAFEYAAAEAGHFIAPQGDLRCGREPMRAWSADPVAIDRRIDAGLRAYLGADYSGEILVGGSSQGVERAVALARRFPNKYRRLVLLSGPAEVSPRGLSGLKGAYFFAGENENVWPSRLSAERFRRAGLPVEFQAIPNAGHSDFGGQGNPLMRKAFQFLDVLG
jgi:predicted esterase